MTNETKSSGPSTNTVLAYKRTFFALERTQMAWVRTGLGLISFGFGIAKFFQFLQKQEGQPAQAFGPMTVGMIMIGLALGGLVFSNIQHHRALGDLRRECADLPRSTAGPMSVMIMVLGVLAFIGALLRH